MVYYVIIIWVDHVHLIFNKTFKIFYYSFFLVHFQQRHHCTTHFKKRGKTKNKDTTDSLNIFSGILIHKLVQIPSHRQELFNHKQFTVPLFSKTFTIIQYTSPLTFNDVFQTGTRHQQRPTGCGPPNMFFHEKGAFQDGLVS